MRRVFVNPFKTLEDDYNIEICNIIWTIELKDINGTAIDYKHCTITLDKNLHETLLLREFLNAFFRIVVSINKLDITFPNDSNITLTDASYALFSTYCLALFNEYEMSWEQDKHYPNWFNVGAIEYFVESMPDVGYCVTSHTQYGSSDHLYGKVYINTKNANTEVNASVQEQTFWHEYIHCLCNQANEFNLNNIEYVVDNLANALCLLMKQFANYIE